MRRWVFALLVGLSLAGLAGEARAQNWPTRAVRVVTPQPAGTGVDLSCRLFADRLSRIWGQPVIVDNKPGADGVLGVSTFVNAHDDHTLLCSFGGPITISPLTAPASVTYDPTTDLKPIASIVDFVLAFAASSKLGVDSLDGLRAAAVARPGALNWSATQGLPLLIFDNYLRATKTRMIYVPYTQPQLALQDLASARIDVYATSFAVLSPVLQSGEGRLLAVINAKRAPQAPNVPTIAELGMPALTVVSFCGFFANRDASDALRAKIAADIERASADAELAPRLDTIGAAPLFTGPQAFAALIAHQRETVETLLAANGGATPQ